MNLNLASPLWVPVKALLCRTITRRRNFTSTAITRLADKVKLRLVVIEISLLCLFCLNCCWVLKKGGK